MSEKEMSKSTNLIEDLLIKFQFNSIAAIKFGEKLQKEENRNLHPLFNSELIMENEKSDKRKLRKRKPRKPSDASKKESPSSDPRQKLPSNDSEKEENKTSDSKKKENSRNFNKFYWDQLKEIMSIAGLTEEKSAYNKRIEEKFVGINTRGHYKGLC
uniref:Uncharacterized protein n=1 Tax=Meloidogyne hapla TaxID=6305 RepID=A0A1I8BV36_MELHA